MVWFLVGMAFVTLRAQTPEGALIVGDRELFSGEFQEAFAEMNGTFGDFGFELEVREAERFGFARIATKYGDPDDTEDVEVTIDVAGRDTRATLRFFYFRDVGFGVRPDDPDQLVVRVKRKEG